MWFHETTHVFGMPIGDWRPVADHPTTAAYFTFGDREYRLKYDLAGYGMAAEKLENRGKPAPEVINPEFRETYQQVVFRFHDLVSKYETTFFATWTPDREDVPLYAPEGQIAAVLRVELDGTGTREWRLGVVTDALCDAFGSVAQIKYQDWVYE